jgi:fucose permease
MEIRLNLSQGVQAIGAVVSPLLAQKVLFRDATDAASLIKVQWTYLGIALFSILLAVAYYYVPLPEVTDSELEHAQARRLDSANTDTINGVRILWISVSLAVLSQWVYVGAQEAVATSLNVFHEQVFNNSISFSSWHAICHSAFAFGRFTSAALNCYVKARHILLFSYLGTITFAALVMTQSGTAAQTTIVLLFFFEGPLFACIFVMALRGVGRHTRTAAAFLTAAISGGGCWPPIMYGVATGTGKGYQYGYVVVIAALATGALLPIWLNVHPVAQKLADPQSVRPGTDTVVAGISQSGSTSRRTRIFKHIMRKKGRSGGGHPQEAGGADDVHQGQCADLATHGLDV